MKINNFIWLIGIIGAIACYMLIDYLLGDLDPDRFGMGKNTTSHIGYFNNIQISQPFGGTSTLVNSIIEQKNPKHKTSIVIGNSQLHAINYWKNGDKLFIEYTNEEILKEKGRDLVYCLSAPHLNVNEMLAYYRILRSQSIKPSILFLSCTFRSFHKISTREIIKEQLNNINIVNNYEGDFLNKFKNQQPNMKFEGQALQNKLESFLMNKLEKIWGSYKNRKNIKAIISSSIHQYLYRIIKKEKTNMLPTNKYNVEQNFLALNTIINLAKDDKTVVVCYVPPYPQKDGNFYYDIEDYKNFTKDLNILCKNNENSFFFNLESLIPIEYWGETYSGDIDPFHFKNEGHKILGYELANIIKTINDNYDF